MPFIQCIPSILHKHFFYRPPPATSFNRSTHNLNFTRDFERFPQASHGFTSMPAGGRMPFRFFDLNKQQTPMDHQRQHSQWRQNMARMQQQQQQKQRHAPAFHFQDQSTSYFMTEPIRTSDDRIAVID